MPNASVPSRYATRSPASGLIMLMALALSGLRADEPQPPAIPIADGGKPVATIVIAEQPTRAASFAALELQLHVGQVTGARLPIANDAAAVPGPRILVGESAATRVLDLAADFKPQEYLIQFLPDTLVLLGRDADSTASMRYDDMGMLVQDESSGTHEGAALPGFFEDRGSLDAVHDFLERHCGVRWYAPGEIGLLHPELPTLAVWGGDIRRSPAMVYRWIVPSPLYLPTPADVVPPRKVDLWKLRMRLGGEPMRVNHSFEGYHARFFNEHPEWFAQGDPDGPRQMCYTHPGFIKQVVQDARDFFDGKGARPGARALGDVFGLAPMDNAHFCRCERCQEQMDEAEKDNPQFTSGYASDYIQGFVDKVAREVLVTHPDKWIATLGYWQYAYHPPNVDQAPNVKPMLCLHVRNWWCPSVEANDRKVLDEWRREEPDRPIYLWLYYNFPALLAVPGGEFNYFPGFFAPSLMAKARAAAGTEVEKQRVALFEKGIWHPMLEGRADNVR